MRWEHFLPSSRALLNVDLLRLRFLRDALDLRDLERGWGRAAPLLGPALTSLKPLVCLKMFRLTLLIFFLDRLKRLSLRTDEQRERADFAEFLDADLGMGKRADLELDWRLLRLLLFDFDFFTLRFELLAPRFFLLLFDFLAELKLLRD